MIHFQNGKKFTLLKPMLNSVQKKIVFIFIFVIGFTRFSSGFSEITYFKPVDGLMLGYVWIEKSNYPPNGLIRFYLKSTTNYMGNYILPATSFERYNINLLTTNMALVQKTTTGKFYGRKVQTSLTRSEIIKRKIHFDKADPLVDCGFFKIDDAFVISEPGKYTLVIKPCLLAQRGSQIEQSDLPVVRIDLDLEPNSLKK